MKTIDVTARFEIRFKHKVTNEQFAQLESGISVETFIDESDVYQRLSSEGECEMDWDFDPVTKKAKGKKRK
jgi:hypothetical protein